MDQLAAEFEVKSFAVLVVYAFENVLGLLFNVLVRIKTLFHFLSPLFLINPEILLYFYNLSSKNNIVNYTRNHIDVQPNLLGLLKKTRRYNC